MAAKPDAEPIEAVVVGTNGKYHFINAGSEVGVQVGDVFETGEYAVLMDPDTGELLHEDEDPAFAVHAELLVEVVFPKYSSTVPIYMMNTGILEKPGVVLHKGHGQRVTPMLGTLNQH